MNYQDDEHRSSTWAGLAEAARALKGERDARMRRASDLLWDALSPIGVSWIGFYEIACEGNEHGAEPGGAMILAPHRDKPACSPIGLHGACGQSWARRETLVVTDVAHLGEGYVACDPRDVSEVVVPCLNSDGTCWGVLDADSFDRGCFDEQDAAELNKFLVACELTDPGSKPAVRTI